MRAFVAVDLPGAVRERLSEEVSSLKESNADVRWTRPENFHLTLKFLGDVSIANLELLTEMIEKEISSHRQFDISVGGSGAFPNIRQPHVVWVGVEAPPELSAIQNGIEVTTSRLGYSREERAFSPHLTLGRVSRNATSLDVKKISIVLETNKIGFLGATCVEKVYLYRSDLQPAGAVYTQIYSSSLIK